MARSPTAVTRAKPGPDAPLHSESSTHERVRELEDEVEKLEQAREALMATATTVDDQDGDEADHRDNLDVADEAISRSAILADSADMAAYLQQHLGQKLTAYLAGLKDVKTVGQWARGKVEPPAITRERLRVAFQATELFLVRYGDQAAQGWFFGANSSLDDHAPAAVLRDAATPDELARIVPLARAFVRGAH